MYIVYGDNNKTFSQANQQQIKEKMIKDQWNILQETGVMNLRNIPAFKIYIQPWQNSNYKRIF